MAAKKKSGGQTSLSKAKAGGAGGKAWRDAIRLELARADGPNGSTLERIARIVVNNALNGDFEAIQEIANRIDGKVAVQSEHEAGEPISKLIVTWEAPRERVEVGEQMKIIEHSPVGTTGGVQGAPERRSGSEASGQEAAFPGGAAPKFGPKGPGSL